MTHLHGLLHGNRALSYFRGMFEFRKLDFRGLKGQFDVKNANFRVLIPKIGYFRPILTSRTNPLPINTGFAMGFLPYGIPEEF